MRTTKDSKGGKRAKASARGADVYLKELGRLPDAGKAEFIREATEWLEWMRARTAKAREKFQPSKSHHQALEDLAKRARALSLAIDRVGYSGVPIEYVREAWTIVAKCQGVPDEPFPGNLQQTLLLVEMTARVWLPDPKPKHRPKESTPSTFLIRLLAERFHAWFGKRPTCGTNSPFVNFCNIALPNYGFSVPSPPTIRGIVEGRKKRPSK